MNESNDVIRDARQLGVPKMLILGLQHMFAHVRSHHPGANSGQQLFCGCLRRGTNPWPDRSSHSVLCRIWYVIVPRVCKI